MTRTAGADVKAVEGEGTQVVGPVCWNSVLRLRRLKILRLHPVHIVEIINHRPIATAPLRAFAAAFVGQVQARVFAFVLAGAAVGAGAAVDEEFVRHTTFTYCS